jgi:hypothetical protein
VWCKLDGKESIATCETDGIREDGTSDGVSGAERRTKARDVGFFSLKSNVQFKVIDVLIKFFGG